MALTSPIDGTATTNKRSLLTTTRFDIPVPKTTTEEVASVAIPKESEPTSAPSLLQRGSPPPDPLDRVARATSAIFVPGSFIGAPPLETLHAALATSLFLQNTSFVRSSEPSLATSIGNLLSNASLDTSHKVKSILELMRKKDPGLANQETQDEMKKLVEFLNTSPLLKEECNLFTNIELTFILLMAASNGVDPAVNFSILDLHRRTDLQRSTFELYPKVATQIPPKTAMNAQWLLMQAAIQSNSLSLALAVINNLNKPFSGNQYRKQVQDNLINRCWEYLKTLSTPDAALAYMKQASEVCELHPINTSLMMAHYCYERNFEEQFKESVEEAKTLLRDVPFSDPNRTSYAEQLTQLQAPQPRQRSNAREQETS